MRAFFENLKARGNATALVCRDGTFSYAELCAETEKLAARFGAEIPRGASVALLADYGFESLAAFFALALNGCIVVPVVSKIEDEIREKLEIAACGFSVLIDGSGNAPRLEKTALPSAAGTPPLFARLRESGAAGLVLFSSGSTGTPKAMIHDLDAFAAAFPPKRALRPRAILLFLLFDHIGGLNTLFRALADGSKIVVPSARAPDEIASLIARENVSVLPATPTFLNLFLMENVAEKFDLSSLKLISYGTEPMPEALLRRLKAAFPRAKFLQTFGTSETGIAQTRSFSSDSTLMKIDDPATECKIENGELLLRSKTQALGYLNAGTAERFTADGWFRTGDVVEKTADGYLRIVGRKSDIINVGGEKVFPAEVENVLLEIPQVADCLVFGEPNPVTGQTVSAKIVLREPMKTLDAKRLVAEHCRGRLARYKIPVRIAVVPAAEFSARFKKIRRA